MLQQVLVKKDLAAASRSGGEPCLDAVIALRSTHLSQSQATFLVRTSHFALGWFANYFTGNLAECYLSKHVQLACKLTFIWPANASGLNTGCRTAEVSAGLFLGVPWWDLSQPVQSWCNTGRLSSVPAYMALEEYTPTLAWKWRILSHRNPLSGIYMWSKLMRFVCCVSRPHLCYKCHRGVAPFYINTDNLLKEKKQGKDKWRKKKVSLSL